VCLQTPVQPGYRNCPDSKERKKGPTSRSKADVAAIPLFETAKLANILHESDDK